MVPVEEAVCMMVSRVRKVAMPIIVVDIEDCILAARAS